MTKKELIIFKIITATLMFFSFIGSLKVFGVHEMFNYGFYKLGALYLLSSLFSAAILVGAMGLSQYKNWGRKLVIVSILPVLILGSLKIYIVQEGLELLLSSLLFSLVIAVLIIYYLNRKNVISACSNNGGQQDEQAIISNSKTMGVLNRDMSFVVNVVILSISLAVLLKSIFSLIRNVMRLGEWCTNEKFLIKVYLIPLVFIIVIFLAVIIFKKRKIVQTILIPINIFALLAATAASDMAFPFGPSLTTTKEECRIDERNKREYQGDVGACAEWERVETRDGCYKSLGIKKRDHAICDKIQDEEDHSWCNIMVASYIDDYTYCDKLDKMHSIKCYYRFADEKKDYTICDHIKYDEGYKEVCRKSACYEIIDPKNLNPNNVEQNTFCRNLIDRD